MSAVNRGYSASDEDRSVARNNRGELRAGAYSNGSYITNEDSLNKEDNDKCPNLIQIDNQLYRFRDPVLDDKRFKTIDIGMFKVILHFAFYSR